MKKAIPVLIAVVLILIIGGVAFGGQVVERYTYSHEQADYMSIFTLQRKATYPLFYRMR